MYLISLCILSSVTFIYWCPRVALSRSSAAVNLWCISKAEAHSDVSSKVIGRKRRRIRRVKA